MNAFVSADLMEVAFDYGWTLASHERGHSESTCGCCTGITRQRKVYLPSTFDTKMRKYAHSLAERQGLVHVTQVKAMRRSLIRARDFSFYQTVEQRLLQDVVNKIIKLFENIVIQQAIAYRQIYILCEVSIRALPLSCSTIRVDFLRGSPRDSRKIDGLAESR